MNIGMATGEEPHITTYHMHERGQGSRATLHALSWQLVPSERREGILISNDRNDSKQTAGNLKNASAANALTPSCHLFPSNKQGYSLENAQSSLAAPSCLTSVHATRNAAGTHSLQYMQEQQSQLKATSWLAHATYYSHPNRERKSDSYNDRNERSDLAALANTAVLRRQTADLSCLLRTRRGTLVTRLKGEVRIERSFWKQKGFNPPCSKYTDVLPSPSSTFRPSSNT